MTNNIDGVVVSLTDFVMCESKDSGDKKFKSNIKYSSLNQMEFKPSSRKDDMTSLFYIFISLLNGNKMPGIYRLKK